MLVLNMQIDREKNQQPCYSTQFNILTPTISALTVENNIFMQILQMGQILHAGPEHS